MGGPHIETPFAYASYYDQAFKGTAPQQGDKVCGRTRSSTGGSMLFEAYVIAVDASRGTVSVRVPNGNRFERQSGTSLQDLPASQLGLIGREP